MAKYSNNSNDQPSYYNLRSNLELLNSLPKNSESQLSSETLAYGVSDTLGGWLGIDKAAQKAAEQVISQMGNDLKLEARKAAQDEVKTIEGKMLTLAEEKANQIEKKISTSIDNTVKSVEANAEKAAKNAAEKAVKKVGPEVADLLKPEIKTQVEEEVKNILKKKLKALSNLKSQAK
ncbi:hypothetical protein [Wolbachia endosymbiont (group B) of Xanthorhoe designata]|uniref:hypothetical protein n=1 Tax=Wolbachia endosymbiont (group B) of Xanthorhoe designata TaxID=3066184 RepID=UPI00333E3BD2